MKTELEQVKEEHRDAVARHERERYEHEETLANLQQERDSQVETLRGTLEGLVDLIFSIPARFVFFQRQTTDRKG